MSIAIKVVFTYNEAYPEYLTLLTTLVYPHIKLTILKAETIFNAIEKKMST